MTKCVSAVALIVILGTFPVTLSHASSSAAAPTSQMQLAKVDAKAEKKAKKAKKAQKKRECRRVRETGSRIASRVCKKPEQWAREEEHAQEMVRRSSDGARRSTGASDG